MRNFLAGAAAGIALTLAGMRLLGLGWNPAANPLVTAAPAAAGGMLQPPAPGAAASAPAAAVSAAAPPVAVAQPPAADALAGGDKLPAAEAAPAEAAANRPAPVVLTEAHARLLDAMPSHHDGPKTLKDLHRQLDGEDEDTNWAYYAKAQILAYLIRLPPQLQFDVRAVECRATLCEIQAFGVNEAGGDSWSTVLSGMRQQPWYRDFSGAASQTDGHDGTSTILTILQRNTGKP